MRRFLLSLAISAGCFPALIPIAKAQNAVPLSLQDCMDYALKHNYAAKNAKVDVLIQQAQNNEITAAAYPKINGKFEYDDYVNPLQSFFPTGDFGTLIGSALNPLIQPLYTHDNLQYPNLGETSGGNTYTAIPITPKYSATAAISGSQTLFDGSVLVALQARNTVMELVRQNGEVTNENIRYNVLKAYNGLVIAYRQYNIIKSSLQYARALEHDIIVTQQNGFAEKIEVERTSVQVNNLATDSMRIGNLLTVSEQLLKYQMGMDINTPIVLTDTNIEQHAQEALSLIEEDADYNRVPEYNLLQTQLRANEFNVKRYQLAALPTLSIFGNAGYNYASNDFNSTLNTSNYLFSFLVGLQLNVPIFNGMQRINQVREAKLNVEKAENSIDNIKLTIDFQTAQSRTTLRNSLLQTESQKRNLELANDVLDLAQKKYKAGVGSNVEVTQAQTDQLNAQNNYFNAMLDVINAEADLKKALGLLNK